MSSGSSGGSGKRASEIAAIMATIVSFLLQLFMLYLQWSWAQGSQANDLRTAFSVGVVSYAILLLAGFLFWYKERSALRRETARARGLEGERRQGAEKQLVALRADERNALREMLRLQRISGNQIRGRFPGVDFTHIERMTTFLVKDAQDFWSGHPDWRDTLRDLLGEDE